MQSHHSQSKNRKGVVRTNLSQCACNPQLPSLIQIKIQTVQFCYAVLKHFIGDQTRISAMGMGHKLVIFCCCLELEKESTANRSLCYRRGPIHAPRRMRLVLSIWCFFSFFLFVFAVLYSFVSFYVCGGWDCFCLWLF